MTVESSLHKKKRQDGYFATVPPREILPIVNSRFESSVKGIFVVGDVTGLPLVKVAANQGVEVITKMEAHGAFNRGVQDDERLDSVIIGGGPAELSAAVEAEKRGLKYVVFERNKVASTVRSIPPGKKVYAEPRFLQNASDLDVDGDLEHLGGYLPWLAKRVKDPTLREAIQRTARGESQVAFFDYDWSLNSQAPRAETASTAPKKSAEFGSGSIPNE